LDLAIGPKGITEAKPQMIKIAKTTKLAKNLSHGRRAMAAVKTNKAAIKREKQSIFLCFYNLQEPKTKISPK